MLPRAEIGNLLTAVFEAVDLAAESRAADRYEVLLLGRQTTLGASRTSSRPLMR